MMPARLGLIGGSDPAHQGGELPFSRLLNAGEDVPLEFLEFPQESR